MKEQREIRDADRNRQTGIQVESAAKLFHYLNDQTRSDGTLTK